MRAQMRECRLRKKNQIINGIIRSREMFRCSFGDSSFTSFLPHKLPSHVQQNCLFFRVLDFCPVISVLFGKFLSGANIVERTVRRLVCLVDRRWCSQKWLLTSPTSSLTFWLRRRRKVRGGGHTIFVLILIWFCASFWCVSNEQLHKRPLSSLYNILVP